jgi:hypothetical protein
MLMLIPGGCPRCGGGLSQCARELQRAALKATAVGTCQCGCDSQGCFPPEGLGSRSLCMSIVIRRLPWMGTAQWRASRIISNDVRQ